MARIKVVGVAGYSGSELARLLVAHPHVDSLLLIDRKTEAPRPLHELRPNLRGTTDQRVVGADDGSPADLIFFATPDGVAMELAQKYLDQGTKVIDFSGDTRLRSAEVHGKWYGIEHKNPNLLKKAVYGLPELHRDALKEAEVIANPGCNATAAILALAPALKTGLIEPKRIVVDCKAGISGAGKHLTTRMHFAEADGNLNAYKVTGHKHTPEIEQELSEVARTEVILTFVPHLLPVSRGILVTAYADLVESKGTEELQSVYESFYADSPFARVLPQGEECCFKAVLGSNFCDLSIHKDERTNRLIVTAVLDNLLKGASGQAVQNMNLALGFPETAGLMQPGLWL
jgi:N-acetyl-gamma-glutamyl-phosphate reductase